MFTGRLETSFSREAPPGGSELPGPQGSWLESVWDREGRCHPHYSTLFASSPLPSADKQTPARDSDDFKAASPTSKSCFFLLRASALFLPKVFQRPIGWKACQRIKHPGAVYFGKACLNIVTLRLHIFLRSLNWWSNPIEYSMCSSFTVSNF